jgi:ketosteroid isomerase-like protein
LITPVKKLKGLSWREGVIVKSIVAIILVLPIFILAAGCETMTTQIDRDLEIAAVTDAINGSIKWCFPDKDRERMCKYTARDSSFFMFQPDSRSTIKSFDEFLAYADKIFFDPRFKPLSSEIKDLRVNLSRGGDVAWFSCLLDDFGEWDGQPVGWKDARWTGVLEKRDGDWLLVQQHFSLASNAPKE